MQRASAKLRWVLWSVVLLELVLVVTVAGAMIARAPGAPPPEGVPARPRAKTRPHATVALAGSGSNLPITWQLVDAYCASLGAGIVADARGCPFTVHGSVGSAGGVRAVAEGAADVGLISRPLRADERDLGLRVVPYARTRVVVATHLSVPATPLTTDDLAAFYRGTRAHWRSGAAATVLLRERGDSTHGLVGAAAANFRAANDQALAASRFPVVYSDDALVDGLVATPGALGLSDEGFIRAKGAPLRVLPLTVAGTPGDGAHIDKELSFVLPGQPDPRARALVAFVASPAGADVLARFGYAPAGAP